MIQGICFNPHIPQHLLTHVPTHPNQFMKYKTFFFQNSTVCFKATRLGSLDPTHFLDQCPHYTACLHIQVLIRGPRLLFNMDLPGLILEDLKFANSCTSAKLGHKLANGKLRPSTKLHDSFQVHCRSPVVYRNS